MWTRLLPALVFLACAFGAANAYGETKSDIAKEKRWADQVIDTLFYGEPVWLEAENHAFLGLEMPAVDGSLDNAAIVVHGIGVHPNWQQIIQPVRVGLSENGWHTLSIQMPILANEAEPKMYTPLFDELSGRFEAAIGHLKKQGISNVVIIAHSMGSAMSAHYLALAADPAVKAAALIGMSANSEGGPVDTAAYLREIKIPLLDLYGSEDLEDVTASAARRLSAAQSGGNKDYIQKVTSGANHFFDGREPELLQTLGEWLNGL